MYKNACNLGQNNLIFFDYFLLFSIIYYFCNGNKNICYQTKEEKRFLKC
ncbi:MAG: hypothetical protein RLZZ628_3912 [Bacteroidota bacterium]|jgi:hypothetical protein